MTATETTTIPLVLTLFGPMQAEVEGQPLPPMRSRKGQWLLALLTLRHDRPATREWLAGTLWPDVEQSQALANLRPVLSELRSRLGSQSARLQSPNRHTLHLNLQGAQVDLLAFDAAIGSSALSALETAVALYQGPLLEGCMEEWVFQERTAREQSCLQALQKLGQAGLEIGDYGKALRWYQQAAAIDPLLESARRGWMEALARNGDRNAALQVYRDLTELLRTEANAVPDEQTTALYARMRAEARQSGRSQPLVTPPPVSAAKIIGYMPHALTEVVGREEEKLEVAARLRRSRLVTLTGMGGIGKTRLALEVAREVVREYADGVWLVSLEALTEGRQVMAQIASVLGIKAEAGMELQESVTQHLRDKRLLLFLDNCEHLLQASADVIGLLLRDCGELRVLATSREALEITGEVAWAVPGLAVPDMAHLPSGQATLMRVLNSYESVQLFVERAQAVQQTFALTSGNARVVAEVCSRLEGIPLAIELAAARVKAMTVEQIAAHLYNELGLLAHGNRSALFRQQTLRATLDWSYALLSESERVLLRRLSVFVGGWTLEAAEQVCSGESIAQGQILDLLIGLVDKSLVAFEERETGGGGRYRMLEMVRQYAGESLEKMGERETLKGRHRNWCVRLAEQADGELNGTEQALWLQRLEIEHDNLRATLAWEEAAAQEAETDLRLTGALWRFWDLRGHNSEGRRYIKWALERDEPQSLTIIRGRALTGGGALAFRQGDYAAAWALHSESLNLQRALRNRRGTAAVLANLGVVALSRGELATAQAMLEESLSIHRELENQVGIADTLGSLSNVFLNQGDTATARTMQEESLSIRRKLGDERGLTWSLESLGVMACLQEDYGAARALFEECLDLRRKLGDKQGLVISLCNLGHVAQEEGDYALARAQIKECLTLCRELINKQGMVEGMEGLAVVLWKQAEWQGAVRLLGAAARLRDNIGSPVPASSRSTYDDLLEQARSALGEVVFAAGWDEGYARTWEQAIEFALEISEDALKM